MDVWNGNPSELPGESLALCTYTLDAEKQLDRRFAQGLVVEPACAVKLSNDHDYLLYTSKIWPRDSRGALLVCEGQLVGIDTEGIKQVQELQRSDVDDINGRLKRLESFVSKAIRGRATYCVAVLATAFKLT